MSMGYRLNRWRIAGIGIMVMPMITIPRAICVEVERSSVRNRADRPHYRQIEKTKFRNKDYK